MNTVYFVRHGENPANITRQFSYRLVDYPLTENGVRQAEETARYLRDRGITAVYASPLKRAVQTAQIIAAPLDLPVMVLEQFREVNVGALERQPPTPEAWAQHDAICAAWAAGVADACFPDGEDYHTLVARMRDGFCQALDGRDGDSIVVAAHGGNITATVRSFCANVGDFTLGSIPNCAIIRMRLAVCNGDVHGTLEGWAECEHLGRLI
jgi:probable phosphoglycerate mutase